jgi:Zn-dependent peptidase ImmA (M78 family)
MKKTKIPKTIVTPDGIYKIKLLSKSSQVLKKRAIEDNHFLGLVDHKKKIIYLQKEQPNKLKVETLWHELGHCFAYYYSFDNSDMFAEAFAKFVLNCSKQICGGK